MNIDLMPRQNGRIPVDRGRDAHVASLREPTGELTAGHYRPPYAESGSQAEGDR